MPTTAKGLRYPASSAAPNVPQDIQNLASDVDSRIGTAWVEDFKSASSYTNTILNTTYATFSGPYTVTVPSGRTLEIEFDVPLVDLPANTGIQMDITVAGTTVQGRRVSNPSTTTSTGYGVTLRAKYAGTGVSVSFLVRTLREGAGASNPAITSGPSVGYVTIHHRIV